MLGTYEAAHELLNKRGNIYSSRPRMPVISEWMSKGLHTVLLPYGAKWRDHHRLQAACVSPTMSDSYRDVQDMESKQLLSDLLTQTDFYHCLHRFSSSLLFSLAYGKRMPVGDEPEVKAVDKIMAALNESLVGTCIVDILPFLSVLPDRFLPGKKMAEELHEFESGLLNRLMADAKKQPSWNWSKQVAAIKESRAYTQTELAYVIGVVYEAGSDTMTMALMVFVLAAVLNPVVVKKAQEELDSVVGSERLPTFDDLEKLPYINAIVKEVHRWRPVIPAGVPHAVSEDDEYMGYRIPKGTMIMGNHWAIHMDPTVYKDPQDFNPDRWIENPDLPLVAFGFGRRKCLGKFYSDVPAVISSDKASQASTSETIPCSSMCRDYCGHTTLDTFTSFVRVERYDARSIRWPSRRGLTPFLCLSKLNSPSAAPRRKRSSSENGIRLRRILMSCLIVSRPRRCTRSKGWLLTKAVNWDLW